MRADHARCEWSITHRLPPISPPARCASDVQGCSAFDDVNVASVAVLRQSSSDSSPLSSQKARKVPCLNAFEGASVSSSRPTLRPGPGSGARLSPQRSSRTVTRLPAERPRSGLGGGVGRSVLRRLLSIIPVLLIVSFGIFFLLALV